MPIAPLLQRFVDDELARAPMLVEADIEVSRATVVINGAVEWEQRKLQTFTSALRGEAHVGTDSNPLRPARVARALWQATAALALPPAPRLLVLRDLASAIGGPLKRAYAAACSCIEAQGVEPSLYRTMLLAPGSQADVGGNGVRHANIGLAHLDPPGSLIQRAAATLYASLGGPP